MGAGKQNITLKIGGKDYSMAIDPSKEEVYRLAERMVNAYAAKFEQAGIEGSSRQDFLALAALQLAISNVAMSQSREVGNDDVKALNAVCDEVSDYLNKLKI
ncbi:MAG: cell division protein ZapA [Alistipes sp.]|jgi:cell division protein ZapA|nr:cell division protein ZapA [Alistipes sp.]